MPRRVKENRGQGRKYHTRGFSSIPSERVPSVRLERPRVDRPAQAMRRHEQPPCFRHTSRNGTTHLTFAARSSAYKTFRPFRTILRRIRHRLLPGHSSWHESSPRLGISTDKAPDFTRKAYRERMPRTIDPEGSSTKVIHIQHGPALAWSRTSLQAPKLSTSFPQLMNKA